MSEPHGHFYFITWLVPSCYVIFDLEPLSFSFDFVFMFEIFKSLSFSLDRPCHLAILCLDQHAHTLHRLESLLTISLDRLDILKEDLFEHEHVGFAAALAVLIAKTSQSRQHESHHHFFPVDTSLIHIESHKSPTKSLYDVASVGFPHLHVKLKYHSDVLAESQG
ncbi:hypothetical protein Tco_0332803 [Tanacetum coccineum]